MANHFVAEGDEQRAPFDLFVAFSDGIAFSS
jgi:hypothetical protein